MPKKLYTSIPKNYPVASIVTAPWQSHVCVSYHILHYWRMKNTFPKKCSKDETCKYYRGNQPVMYARGCTNFQKRKFPD